MARPQYPSDLERKKTEPHVRVFTGIRTHPRTAGQTPLDRGMMVGIWIVGRQANAGTRGNVVTLSRDAVEWITGIFGRDRRRAERVLAELCARLDYDISARCTHGERPVGGSCAAAGRTCGGGIVSVTIRNFEHKQGFHSAAPPRSSADSALSESESEAKAKSEGVRAERSFKSRKNGVLEQQTRERSDRMAAEKRQKAELELRLSRIGNGGT